MTAASTPPLHVLRGILRHVKPTPSHKAMSPPKAAPVGASSVSDGANRSKSNGGQVTSVEMTLRDHVLAQYRANVSVVSPKRQAVLRRLAYDYLALKNDLAERGRLHELDGGAEVKLSPAEMTRRAAARAGLQVPKLDRPHDL